MNLEAIYEWLTIAKGEKPDTMSIPHEQMQLILSIILEELSELAESAGKEHLLKFTTMLDKKSTSLLEKIDKQQPLKSGEEAYRDACTDLFVVLGNAYFHAGISLKMAQDDFQSVMSSNNSKFCNTEEEAIQSVEKYKLQGIEVKYEKRGDVYVILRASDNKILKGINFKEPNFKQ